MNRWIMLVLALLLALLSACTPYIYGVPKLTWDTMSEPERLEAMQIYKERQIANRMAMEERARLNAIERAKQQARAAEAERLRQERFRQERIAAIHRGEGAYGDLLRVSIEGGEMWIAGRHRHYQPLTIKIADGEYRELTVTDDRGNQANLTVAYDDRALVIDGPGDTRKPSTARLRYDRKWERGSFYTGISTTGPLQLRGVEVQVEVASVPNKATSIAPQPQVVVIQQPAPPPPKPQVIIVKEEQPRRQQTQVILVRDEKPQPPAPQVIVRNDEQPRHHQQPQLPGVKEEKPQPQVVVVKEPKPTPQRNEVVVTPPVSAPTPPAVTPVREIPLQEKNRPAAAAPIESNAPGRIDVSFIAVQMKIRGKYQPIEPLTTRLNDGETREVSLKTPEGAHPVTVSYRNGLVTIDADPVTGRGKATAARLPFEKEWKTGRLYHIETKGRLNLVAAEVRILTAAGN